MLRVPVHKIQPGMILARPVPLPTAPHRTLLPRDREIPMDLAKRLQEMGVLEVWVRHGELGCVDAFVDEELGEQQHEVYGQVRRSFEQLMQDTAALVDYQDFQSVIGGLFGHLRQHAHGNVLLQKLDAYDNYLMSHSANVCYLGLLLGMKLERYIADQPRTQSAASLNVQDLALGCLLHDVGKMGVASDILRKPSRLDADEMDAMRLHPVHGYAMVRGKIPTAAANVVLNHHQRYGGGGYPDRFDPVSGHLLPSLAGEKIPIFSRIATVVDVYDAATTSRCYSPAKLPVKVLDEMRRMVGTFFDPVVAQAFFEIIPPFPIGQTVTLSDGAEAVVVDFNPHCPARPKVQPIRYPNGERVENPSLHELDLAMYADLEIAFVDGADVRPYQASQQESATLATLHI